MRDEIGIRAGIEAVGIYGLSEVMGGGRRLHRRLLVARADQHPLRRVCLNTFR